MNTIRDPSSGRAWTTVRELTDHIESSCHGYLRLTLPLLDSLTDRIAREHVLPVTQIDRLQRQLTALADLLQTHVARQEALLFPKIRHLREPVGETAWVCQTADSVTELMDRSIADDREAMDLLGRVEACLRETAWRDRGCLVEQLAEDLRELHQDLAEHFRIEHELLFPAVRDAQAEGLAV